jgi:molecular chaperone Hsp33
MKQHHDQSLRFLFEQADIRGETSRVHSTLQEVLALHQHAPGVKIQLGQFMAAAALLATTLKFEGKLVLQARSNGQIPLLMVECDDQLQMRAIARGAEEATASDFHTLFSEGQLAITIDPTQGQRYQGVVPLDGTGLAQSLDAYFEQSEQLGTRFWLASDGEQAAGLLLQQLPPQIAPDPAERLAQWEHLIALTATLSDEELVQVDTPTLLHRLFHEEDLRLFTPQPIRFHCTCSRERTLGALATLGAPEIEEILTEQGAITMDCEFCNQRYQYAREDLAELLSSEQSNILH